MTDKRAVAVPTGEAMFGHRSYVYFAANADAIKIGFSTQPFIRQGQLHPRVRGLLMIGLVPGNMDDEHALHEQFDHLRLPLYGEREWFRTAPEIVDFIDELEASNRIIPWVVYERRMRRQNRLMRPWGFTLKSVQLLRGEFPHVEYLGGLGR